MPIHNYIDIFYCNPLTMDESVINFDKFDDPSSAQPGLAQENSPQGANPMRNEIVPAPDQRPKTWFSRMTCGKFDSREQEIVIDPNPQINSKVPLSEEQPSSRKDSVNKLVSDQPANQEISAIVSPQVQVPSPDVPVVQVQPASGKLQSCITLIGSSTLVFLYYACFFSNLLAALHLLLMTDQPILGIVIFSLVGLNYLARITFWCSLEEEWTQQLPYIDDQALNTFRQVLIYIATTLNLDTPYWLYQIYHNGRRDGEIEYIVNLQRTGQTVFEHLPVLYITTFMFIHENQFDQDYLLLPAIVFNLLNSVALMYGVNFFNADAFDTFKWSLLRICELWSKTTIFCFALNLLMVPESQIYSYVLIASCLMVAVIWFTFFNDFKTETVSGSMFSFAILLAKVIAIFSFREINFGFDRIDTEAQPSLLVLKSDARLYLIVIITSNTKLTYTINLVFYLQLLYVCWLWNAWPIVQNFQFQQYIMGSGAVCFAIVSLYYMVFGFQTRDYSSYVNMDEEEE